MVADDARVPPQHLPSALPRKIPSCASVSAEARDVVNYMRFVAMEVRELMASWASAR